MAKWTFETTRVGYGNMWRAAKLKGGADASNADRFAKLIIAGEARYRVVQGKTGVPWFFIGALHMRESSCSFAGVLHNGDRIIGTGGKTVRVPAGRGPFNTWEESAVDALKLKGLEKIKDWPVERMGYEAERFNGLGYVGKGVNSAYVWAGTTLEQRGKYVADHVWDKDFDDPQIGIMAVLKRLAELRPDIAAQLQTKDTPMDIDPGMVTKPQPTSPPPTSILADLLSNPEVLAQIVALITTVRGAVQAPKVDAPATAPAKTGFGTGIIGMIGYVIANAFGFVGSPTGAGATAAGQIIPAVLGGITALGATGGISGALGIIGSIISLIAKSKKTG